MLLKITKLPCMQLRWVHLAMSVHAFEQALQSI